MAAMALDDSVEPRIASRVDKRACEKLATDANVVDEKWKVAAAKKDAEVTVVCKVANCIGGQHGFVLMTGRKSYTPLKQRFGLYPAMFIPASDRNIPPRSSQDPLDDCSAQFEPRQSSRARAI